jgi:thiamine-phosphate pyrophosphorylase
MLVLMTDDERLPDPLAAARLLPKGSMVVVRSRDADTRTRWAHSLVALARSRGLLILVANDAELASQCGADGLHLSEAIAHLAPHWRALRPRWFISAAAHSLRALMRCGSVDAIFFSPVFPTSSHPGKAALSATRANRMIGGIASPVYALGGVTASNATLLRGYSGIAAIGALAP